MGPYQSKVGLLNDCVEFEFRLTLARPGQSGTDDVQHAHYCDGYGFSRR